MHRTPARAWQPLAAPLTSFLLRTQLQHFLNARARRPVLVYIPIHISVATAPLHAVQNVDEVLDDADVEEDDPVLVLDLNDSSERRGSGSGGRMKMTTTEMARRSGRTSCFPSSSACASGASAQ